MKRYVTCNVKIKLSHKRAISDRFPVVVEFIDTEQRWDIGSEPILLHTLINKGVKIIDPKTVNYIGGIGLPSHMEYAHIELYHGDELVATTDRTKDSVPGIPQDFIDKVISTWESYHLIEVSDFGVKLAEPTETDTTVVKSPKTTFDVSELPLDAIRAAVDYLWHDTAEGAFTTCVELRAWLEENNLISENILS